MNAIDLMELNKNGESNFIPQFARNGYTIFHKDQPNDSYGQINDIGIAQETYYPKWKDLKSHTYFFDKSNPDKKYYMDEGWGYKENEINDQERNQNMTMLYNALEAMKTRNFNERMYDQRYQKIIQDIKKAGLNPYAINFFSPGGVQSGSAASIMSNYQASNSQVRSKSENHNHGDVGTAGILGAFQTLGLVLGAIIKALI